MPSLSRSPDSTATAPDTDILGKSLGELSNKDIYLPATLTWVLAAMLGASLVAFPLLALGLSGFETGVSMMSLVRRDEGDDQQRPAGRIRNTRKTLTAAALIMSFYLLTTTFVTAVLIPQAGFEEGDDTNGRALAYLAYEYLGEAFGTVYDLSTNTILSFAGA